MLKFASITPHPPVIIPTIGKKRDLKETSKTIKAMEKLAKNFKKAVPDTVIVISPHAPLAYDEMTISISPTLTGNFYVFGDSYTKLTFKNNLDLVDTIQQKSNQEEIPVGLKKIEKLDHGALVPLYYLTQNLSNQEKKNLNVVLIAYSYLNRETHLKFGRQIFKAINENKSKNKKIALIASGDLSHRLTLQAPGGYSEKGVEFDRMITAYLAKNKFKKILNIDKKIIKEAGECGYLSIITLLGVLTGLRKSRIIKRSRFDVLSYQAPFGVGYLVANVKGL